ncbi:hypothetical protein SARC_11286 [Sphaeroforma arctica JP610]|uniref:Uncharacterized protein n=1 Tax=Sphaeroforma arctica JP610 TaxID=667725 RepID=A0A0L0FHF0_9EUKA|nr:hypothetical protein SARC_11286 [Sphaeroforma arctica JP610]KNC76202.1 hypothetical protein SARC_11286 [Sphaeroforma arctica JP610]|eukprot:XP_014150104.1 hypothetical protein SARC_11286 [Sphaeroforma arctica JP610]
MLYVNGGDLFDCVQSVERLLQFEAQSIQRPQSHSKPIITLIIDNQCLESISLIPAAYNLQLRCVLLPRSRRHLLPYVQRHTGTTHYIEYRNTDPESFTEPCLDFMEGPYMHSDPIDKNKDQDELTEECKEKLDAAIRAQLGSAGGGFVCMLTSSISKRIGSLYIVVLTLVYGV